MNSNAIIFIICWLSFTVIGTVGSITLYIFGKIKRKYDVQFAVFLSILPPIALVVGVCAFIFGFIPWCWNRCFDKIDRLRKRMTELSSKSVSVDRVEPNESIILKAASEELDKYLNESELMSKL